MRPTASLIAMVLAAGAATAAATTQQTATTPTATSCAQAQATIDQLLAAADARVEAARLTNSPADMRAAVEALQNIVRDVRTQLAPCATLKAEDPHSGHAVALPQSPGAKAPAAAAADEHAGHGMPPATTTATTDIVAWLKSFDAAFVAKDLARLAAFYHPEVTVFEGAGVDTGWADYRDTHLGPELKSFEQLTFGHLNPAVRMLGEHAAFVTSEFFLKALANGKPIDVTGRETLVLEHADGAWKIRHQQMAVRARVVK